MIARRHLLATAAAFLVLGAAPLAAQHNDLGVEEAPDVPMPRRFMMEDTYGNVVTDEDLRGKFALIYFGYTGCPDVCPTSLATMADALDLLGADVEGVSPIFVTVDPDRDTAQLMQDYTAFFHKSIIGLRGPKEYTDHMVKTFNARYEVHVPDAAHPDRYSIDHTASIAFLGPDGMLIKRFPHGTTAEDMAADIAEAIAAARAQ